MSTNPLDDRGSRIPLGDDLGAYHWGHPGVAQGTLPGAFAAAPTGQEASSAPASTGLRRFQPADGLFLRAEHLAQIQTYAADLAALNGVGGGGGVVYGFTLTLDAAGQSLSAAPGLAFEAAGRPLRSQGALQVDLSGLDRSGADQIWIVEVVTADEIPGGNEPVYSSVCATSCRSDSSFQPWRDDAVRLRVRAETLAVQGNAWSGVQDVCRRSALASAYFERERRQGGPWLTPSTPGGAIPDLASWPWAKAAPAGPPGPGGVPVGLLYADQSAAHAWHLDVWTARRDRVLTPPATAWENHLSRRPLPAFTAQVLQFQDHLAAGNQDLFKNPLNRRFVELPPAGFLPRPTNPEWDDGRDSRLRVLLQIFGHAVLPIPVSWTADAAITAVNLAQHLDRIPLRASKANLSTPNAVGRGFVTSLPLVLVLVPDVPADLAAVRPADDRYPWIAFVRVPRFLPPDRKTWEIVRSLWATMQREDLRVNDEAMTSVDPTFTGDATDATAAAPHPEPDALADDLGVEGPEPVPVHVLTAPLPRSEYPSHVEAAITGTATAEASFTGFAATVSSDTADALHAAIDALGPYRMIDVLATTAEPARQPMAAARAKALADALGLDTPEKPVGVNSRVADGPESVFLMVRKR